MDWVAIAIGVIVGLVAITILHYVRLGVRLARTLPCLICAVPSEDWRLDGEVCYTWCGYCKIVLWRKIHTDFIGWFCDVYHRGRVVTHYAYIRDSDGCSELIKENRWIEEIYERARVTQPDL